MPIIHYKQSTTNLRTAMWLHSVPTLLACEVVSEVPALNFGQAWLDWSFFLSLHYIMTILILVHTALTAVISVKYYQYSAI